MCRLVAGKHWSLQTQQKRKCNPAGQQNHRKAVKVSTMMIKWKLWEVCFFTSRECSGGIEVLHVLSAKTFRMTQMRKISLMPPTFYQLIVASKTMQSLLKSPEWRQSAVTFGTPKTCFKRHASKILGPRHDFPQL
jgi:hypothetical protein